MVHQPFSEWIVSGDPLTSAQRDELARHLANCPDCERRQQAWEEVQLLLSRSALINPPLGFQARLLARLAAQRRRRYGQQAWLAFGAILAGSVALAVALIYFGAAGLAEGAGQLLKQLVVLRAAVSAAADLVGHVLAALPPGGAELWRYSLLVALSGLALATYLGLGGLWAAAVYRFGSMQSRIGGSQ